MSSSIEAMNTAIMPMYRCKWNELPWAQLERSTFKLQKRIYQASQRNDVKTVHRLQRLLTKSWAAKCLAVRKVTQDNQGKKTAGVDGVKSLTPDQRLALVPTLKLSTQARPIRRVWIPKPGTGEKRGLGIPVMYDRALQTLVKLALEPEWEARFEPNSYGFRPGRSCHDALGAIFTAIKQKPKYVLDADVAKCFDRINHAALLDKMHTTPILRRQTKAWLKAGMVDKGELFPTREGTPQGGPLSPLLANIALHGMETYLKEKFTARYFYTKGSHKHAKISTPALIRYADDLVVVHPDLEVVQQCKTALGEWLKNVGLELKPSKTRITHTLEEYDGNVGFDFLGFHVRQRPMGKYRSGRLPTGQLLGFKTLITPSKANVKEHQQKLGEIVHKHKAAPQERLIARLNPVITGWTRYYSAQVSSRTFNRVDGVVYHQLRRWAYRRHAKKSRRWVSLKYWVPAKGWIFTTKDRQYTLAKHAQTPIRRHVKVQNIRSPYDGDWVYWATRMGKHPESPQMVGYLLKKQRGKCAWCNLYFASGDLLERDHLVPTILKGSNARQNRQLLHRHCHDIKTSQDGSLERTSTK